MNALRVVAASVLMLSLVGCCCGRNVVCDTCDPCGSASCGSSCGFGTGFLRNRPIRNLFKGGCNSCGSCYSDMPTCGGCSSCAAPGGFDGFSGMPTGGSGCGCSQGATQAAPQTYYDPNIPSTMPTPSASPTPSAVAPVPPSTTSPANEPGAMIPSTGAMPVQTVTYEEFQKLPGTIISGPGTGTTTPGAPLSAPAATTTTPLPSVAKAIGSTQRVVARPQTGVPVASNQKQLWVPVR